MTGIVLTDTSEDLSSLAEELSAFLESASASSGTQTEAISEFWSTLPEKIVSFGLRLGFVIIFILVGVQLIKLLRNLIRTSMTKMNADTGAVQFVDSFVKAALYVLLILTVATSFGLDSASVVALVGSAGVAIGLAVQDSLSNLAGGVQILALKPFKVGDYVVDADGHEGTVSKIEIFYTRLTTPDNKTVVLPNGALANSCMVNVTEAHTRRMDIKVWIPYSADIKKAKAVLLQVVQTDETVLKDKDILVFVDELGESAVILDVRCWFRNEDFWPGKWRITENCKYAMDEAGIPFAYPSMSIYRGDTPDPEKQSTTVKAYSDSENFSAKE